MTVFRLELQLSAKLLPSFAATSKSLTDKTHQSRRDLTQIFEEKKCIKSDLGHIVSSLSTTE